MMIQYASLSANRLKVYAALKLKKQRQKYDKFLVEGEKIVMDLVRDNPSAVEAVIGHTEALERFSGAFPGRQYLCMEATAEQLDRLSSLQAPPGIIAVARCFSWEHERILSEGEDRWFLVLDGIRDPGNLGTILRTADWFGFQAVLCSGDTVDLYNAKTIQAAMGSLGRIPVLVGDWSGWLSSTDLCVVGAGMEGTPVQDYEWPAGGALVIGSESHGISAGTAGSVRDWVHIPRRAGSKAESLNAAIATSILAATIPVKR